MFWPCPSEEHPGTPRLFLDRFATPDGRAVFHPVQHRPPAEEPDDAFPLYLTTGRVLAQYQTGAQTRRVPSWLRRSRRRSSRSTRIRQARSASPTATSRSWRPGAARRRCGRG